MKHTKKTKCILFMLLILLNLILRYAIVPHELTNDSFEMHIIANSLSEFGEPRWWTHPLSVIGVYPNSYASATSFLMSGISQCTGLEIEIVTFVLGLILGVFSIFASYILAGKIYNDDFFKFVVAFGFSVSPGILAFTTWALHARVPFILLVPLFLYALLQTKKYSLRFGLITVLLVLLLLVTHHLVFYLIPIFVAWFLVTLVYILKEHVNVIKKVIKKSENLMPLFIILAFCLMFAYAFMSHKFMSGGGSRWDYLRYKEHMRYTGLLVLLAVGGFAYLVFKHKKHYGEWSLLTMLMFLSIFIQQQMYMKWLIIIFAILLAGIGLTNIKRLGEKKRKPATLAIVIFLLLAVCFSGYFQFLHAYAKPFASEKYVEDSTYTTALWLKENLNGTSICNHKYIGWKICAISGLPFLAGSDTYDQAYGLLDVSELAMITLPRSSEEYWLDSPYKVTSSDSDDYWHRLLNSKYDRDWGPRLLSKFNLTHMIENTRTKGFWSSHHGRRDSKFLHSLYGEKCLVYNNGNIIIWPLEGGT